MNFSLFQWMQKGSIPEPVKEATLAGFHLREKGEKVTMKNWFMVISFPERLTSNFTEIILACNKTL